MTPKVTLVADLNPPGGGAWQGAAILPDGGVMVAHSRGTHVGGSAEDVHLYRFGPSTKATKPYRDQAVLVDAGHVYGFGVDATGNVWATWDGPDGNDVVRMPFPAGRTVRKSAAEKLHVFTERSCQVALSPTRKGLVLMETMGKDRFRLTKRMTADVLANRDLPIGRPLSWSTPRGTWLQGFSVAGDSIYVLCGRPDAKAWLERYDVNTGAKTGVLDVTRYGYLEGEPHDGREPEGMDGRHFSVKVHHDDRRRMRVFRFDGF